MTQTSLGVGQNFYRRPLPRHYISFCSLEGKRLFREALLSGYMENYFNLASQFCTQEEPAYCGLTTLVMVLNAFDLDPGRVWKGPWRWYHESMINCCLPPDVLTKGIVLDKFVQIARCYGLNVDLFRVYPGDSLNDFRDMVSKVTSGKEIGFLIVSYSRSALGQTGSGHFAPIGGYHSERELVLIFDTARFKYPCHWVPLARLWTGMSHNDPVTQLPRGFMVLRKATISPPLSTDSHQAFEEKNQRSSPSVRKSDIKLNLQLFDISDAAHQAYLFPSVFLYETSSSFNLKKFIDFWIEWLIAPNDLVQIMNDKQTDSKNLIIMEAIRFLFNTIEYVKYVSFLFTIRPLIFTKDNNRVTQHDIVHDILNSPIGRLLSKFVQTINTNLFDWLMTDGPIRRLPSSKSSSLYSHCLFAIMSDSGIRLTLLLTVFFYSFPYNHLMSKITTVTNSEQDLHNSRLQDMARLVDENVGMLDGTRIELFTLESLLWSLISTAVYIDDSNSYVP